ncbi:hypothetical protein R1flu_006225 [Riccia fluitans]|uniref:Uncharacterized protein n=1 Tax=Riccia fluitans TaxID=41844 RepID=A0ABD1YW20_9MARC
MASSILHLQVVSTCRNWMPMNSGAGSKPQVKSLGGFGICSKCMSEPIQWNKFTRGKSRARLNIVRAALDEDELGGGTDKVAGAAVEKQESEKNSSAGDRKAANRAEIERGRNTAIITGAISVLLGVGYLVLIQLLDTRGIELIPPPPEAFDP